MASKIGNNLPRIKVSNQSAIRETIYKFGPISRTDIANRLNLTFPTITTNINLMISEGLLEEKDSESIPGSRGRKTMLVDYVPSSRLFLGVEMRRHASYATIVDLRGRTLAYSYRKVFHDSYEGSMKEALDTALTMMDEKGYSWNDLSGFGFCLPGIVDAEKGILDIHPRFKWKELNVKEDVERATGCTVPITVLNNTCARVYGASLFNCEVFKGADYAAYMCVGSGIKCPLVFSLRDTFGTIVGEGEVGHMVMDPDGPVCRCGNHGCLESYASDSSLIDSAYRAIERGESTILEEMSKTRRITVDDIVTAEAMGDDFSLSLVTKAVKYLSLAIANANNFVKPDCTVVESRLFKIERNRKMLEEYVRSNLSWSSILEYDLSFVDYREEGGARGAAAAAIRDNLQIFME